MIVRYRLCRIIGLCCLIPALSGCSDRFFAGPLHYIDNEAPTKDIKDRTNLAGKTRLQDKVRTGLVTLFGPNPQRIIVPEGMGELLTAAGRDWPISSKMGRASSGT